MSSTIKFIKIIFPFPKYIYYNLFHLFSFSTFTNCKTPHFSYTLCANHQAHKPHKPITIHNHSCYAYFFHTTIHQITQNTPNTCMRVLVLSRDFLGNLIPKPNIEPHLVVMFLHLKDYGLSPNPQSLGFHIPILHIKPPSGDGYPNPISLGIRIPMI